MPTSGWALDWAGHSWKPQETGENEASSMHRGHSIHHELGRRYIHVNLAEKQVCDMPQDSNDRNHVQEYLVAAHMHRTGVGNLPTLEVVFTLKIRNVEQEGREVELVNQS